LDRDVRSDETKNSKYYRDNQGKNPSRNFFKEKGDGTILKKVSDLILREDKESIATYTTQSVGWRETVKNIYSNIDKNSKSLGDHFNLIITLINE